MQLPDAQADRITGPDLTVVIGAGPAGAACALWLHQFGLPVLVIEKNATAGGLQNQSPYENIWLPGIAGLAGKEIGSKLHRQLVSLCVPLHCDTSVVSVRPDDNSSEFIVTSTAGTVRCQFVVVATGTRFRTGGFTPTGRLAIGPGHNFEALDIAGKSLAILGGGDNAFDAYGFARRKGAARCTIFARSVRAHAQTRRQADNDDVYVGEYQVDQAAMTVNGKPYDAVSVQYGFEPVIPEGLSTLARTSAGYVAADIHGCTSIKGLYAVGEVANTFHPCVATSFAHGIQAAKHIQRLIQPIDFHRIQMYN